MTTKILYPSYENINFIDEAKAEMRREETAFLLTLLKQVSPKTILEIGVASGGTSVYLLKNMRTDAQLFSCDISVPLYYDNKLKTGYKVDSICDDIEKSRWKTIFGCDIVDVIDSIGSEIDFCIIDTSHALPGELLSFIAVLPYMRKGSFVVLHDTHLNHFRVMAHCNEHIMDYSYYAFSTTILFSSISSEVKYSLPGVSNIGAFQINKNTSDNIRDIFDALFVSWHYYPHDLIDKYANMIEKQYSAEYRDLFVACSESQKKLVDIKKSYHYEKLSIEKELAKIKHEQSNTKNVEKADDFHHMSYIIGCTITYIPRKNIAFFRCWKHYGLKNTIQATITEIKRVFKIILRKK